jgi:hypothetical protein
MDGNKKKFIPQLAIDTAHSAFVNPVQCKTKGAVGAVCALLRICALAGWRMGGFF